MWKTKKYDGIAPYYIKRGVSTNRKLTRVNVLDNKMTILSKIDFNSLFISVSVNSALVWIVFGNSNVIFFYAVKRKAAISN